MKKSSLHTSRRQPWHSRRCHRYSAPILLPITARLGFTKFATASMLFIMRWMQRHTAKQDDYYDADEVGSEDVEIPPRAGRTTNIFSVALIISVV